MQAVPGFTPPPPYTVAEAQLVHSYAWFLWGIVFCAMLFGVTVAQGWTYLTSDKKDGGAITAVVLLVLGLDSATTILAAAAGQHWLVDNFGNAGQLARLSVALNLEEFCTVLVVSIVQLFFAKQVYTLNKKSWPVVVVIVILSLTALGLGIGVTAETFIDSHRDSLLSVKLTTMIAVGQGMNVLCDMVATIAMTYMLHYARTGRRSTSSLITSLLIFIIGRGIFVSIIQITFMITFVSAAEKTYWVFFHLILSKCYVNTFLLMLNSRSSLRQKAHSSMAGISEPSHHFKHISLSKLRATGDDKDFTQHGTKGEFDPGSLPNSVAVTRVEETFNDDGTLHVPQIYKS